jgi:predicted component of type VI protein secretion system
MNADHFPLFAVSIDLENNKEFIHVQALAQQDGQGDLLSHESADSHRQRWTEISHQTAHLQRTWSDVRLTVLSYRALLFINGLSAGLACYEKFSMHLEQASVQIEELKQGHKAIFFSSLCYFFTPQHMSDLRLSPLGMNGFTKTGQVLQASLDGLKEPLQTWLPKQTQLNGFLQAAQSFLYRLEGVLRPLNNLGVEMNATDCVVLLKKLEALLKQNGCPSSQQNNTLLAVACDANSWGEEGLQTPSSSHLKWNRQQVIEQMEQLASWFSVHEPSNPAPFFLRRAIKLCQSDFMGMLQELLPDAVPQFEKLAGASAKK